ncbi:MULTISPECIES: hypothetical protein [unclassified Sphingomonas]|jgi:hypothetical protein|uniref:hypothetical protein n=1 Tax=unclassified Sphingomonas TaxID=196159 RepID=UPI000E0FFF7F|nr:MULTISPECIES: hypothetical protein [unclassified Sphingomonas]AXJ96507.1 hypothetical protein DM480_14430 [Sphingomonas sp. FARSPH]
MIRHLRRVAIVTMPLYVMGLCALPATAVAGAMPRPIVPLSDTQLDAARGGFSWGGMSISFGADTQTFLNGQLALQTVVRWSDTGASTVTTSGGGVTPATLAQLQSQMGRGLNIPASVAGNQVFLANAGQTALIQGANQGLQNILLNSAAGLNASQVTNATLSIGNYASFASALHSQALGNALSAQIVGIGR